MVDETRVGKQQQESNNTIPKKDGRAMCYVLVFVQNIKPVYNVKRFWESEGWKTKNKMAKKEHT